MRHVFYNVYLIFEYIMGEAMAPANPPEFRPCFQIDNADFEKLP